MAKKAAPKKPAKGAGRRIIVSIGGNTLIRRGEAGTIEEQFDNAGAACSYVAKLSSLGSPVIITHGNGPVVGNIYIRGESAKDIVPPMPLFICDADSEGGIGFMLQQTLYNELKAVRRVRDVVTVVTQVVVREDDPAFADPTKPIGPYYSREESATLTKERGWAMAEDRLGGFRRVVPSPVPVRIIESKVIRRLSDSGVIVIAAGGGGVPVVEREDGTLRGVDAVIDKDRATAVLANEVDAGLFINLTNADMVYTGFGRPGQKGIKRMDLREAGRLLKAGEFPPGSMGPKIEAAIEFLEGGRAEKGREVIITRPELIEEAVKGRAGTRIVRG